MDIAHAVFLAVVQGVTEFLPISSSAHLVLFADVFGGISSLHVDIVLHGATLLAAVVYFAKDIRNLLSGGNSVYLQSLAIATVPIVVAGWFIYNGLDVFRVVSIIAAVLIISGTVLLLADYLVRRGLVRALPLRLRGLVIGLLQVLAVLPGVSRAGITMTGGLLTGFSRTEASRFSFLLAIPTIASALVLAVLDTGFVVFSPALGIAFVIAFAVAYTVIHYFLRLIERIGFAPFALYQIALGAVFLAIGTPVG